MPKNNLIKNTLLGVFLTMAAACTNAPSLHQSTVEEYYRGLNAGDFYQVSSVVADTFTIIEGDFETAYTVASHEVLFRWDSVFATTYEIKKVTIDEGRIQALVSSSSDRYRFLENDPLVCEMNFSFKQDKISQLYIGDCPEADWERWSTKRDSLVQWVDQHHPNLSGFINDLTEKGAQDYMNAVGLFEANAYD